MQRSTAPSRPWTSSSTRRSCRADRARCNALRGPVIDGAHAQRTAHRRFRISGAGGNSLERFRRRRSASPLPGPLLRQSNHACNPPWATDHDFRRGARRAAAGLISPCPRMMGLESGMTVAIEMGQTAAGAAAAMDLEELLATRLLVQGNSGSGKSHLLRRLLEQSAPWVQQVIIDPEGDFVTLAERFGHLVIDAEDHTERGLQAAGERARIHRVSAVLNLEGLDAENQMRRAAAFLNGLFEAPRDHWYPMLVVVDEAQLFAPAIAGEVSDEARKLSLGAMTNLMCRGRKRGLAGIIATQRLAKLAKNVAAEASNFLMGRTFLDIDMARAADLLGMERRQAETFRDLERGQFMALGPALSRRPLGLRIGPTETTPRNAIPRLMPMPEATPDAHAIILAAPPPEISRPRRRSAPDLLGQLMAAKTAALEIRPEATEQPLSAEELAERRERVDRILRAVMAEPDAGFRAIGVLYQEFVVR